MSSPYHFTNITPAQISLTSEKSKSKSGQERTKITCTDTKTDWKLTVEGANMSVIFEDMGPDGTLGKFGITDERAANYSLTLVGGVIPEHLDAAKDAATRAHIAKSLAEQETFFEFVRGIADKGVEFMMNEGLLKKKVDESRKMATKLFKGAPDAEAKVEEYILDNILAGATIPIGLDDRTGNETLKMKQRLCKWAPEGESAVRNVVRIFAHDGVKFKRVENTKICRYDWVRPTIVFNFWSTPSAYGVSAEIKSILLLRQGPGDSGSSMPSMSVPDLPPVAIKENTEEMDAAAEPSLKRAKTSE